MSKFDFCGPRIFAQEPDGSRGTFTVTWLDDQLKNQPANNEIEEGVPDKIIKNIETSTSNYVAGFDDNDNTIFYLEIDGFTIEIVGFDDNGQSVIARQEYWEVSKSPLKFLITPDTMGEVRDFKVVLGS